MGGARLLPQCHMANPLLRKLSNFRALSSEEQRALTDACTDIRPIAAREDVILQGQPTAGVHVLLEGFACRYKVLENGRRQIVSYVVPGDLCDLRVFIHGRMDHSIGGISPSKFALIAPQAVQDLTDRYPQLTRALWWSTLVEEAILREWIVGVGQRGALERMGHLFCELFFRFRAVGMHYGTSCAMPLTQLELGETLGLSAVHVNRTLQELRRQHLITLEGGVLTLPDLDGLARLSLFNPDYLHLNSA